MKALRTIAAAQTLPLQGDIEANLDQHAHLTQSAAEEEVDVLLFPELSLTGYEPKLAKKLAFTPDDPRLEMIRDLAASHRMTLIVGAPVRLASLLHIGAFIVSPFGTIELYTKHHLGVGEEPYFKAGTRNPPLVFDGTKAALAVCADVKHASHARNAAERGAELYLASVCLTPEDLPAKSAALQGYAAEHSMAVVMANTGGPSSGFAAGGRSTLWSAQGELLAQLEEHGAGLVIGTRDASGWSAKALAFSSGC